MAASYLWMLFLLLSIETMHAKISINLEPRRLSSTINYESSAVNLSNSLNRIYTAQISIGTPSIQSFNVVIDTGTADLWVFSAMHSCIVANQCNAATWQSNDCSNTDTCCFFNDIMNSYNHDISSLNHNNWSVTYGKGTASGYLSSDTVSIGTSTVEKQVFAEATRWSDLLVTCVEPYSGILGLAMTSASKVGTNSLIESLYNQNQIQSKVFSVSLKGMDQVSELIIGEIDGSKYINDIIWSAVVNPTDSGMWIAQLTGMLLTDNDTLRENGNYTWLDACVDCVALFDTGTSYITMPSTKYQVLLNYLDDYATENGADCLIYSSTTFLCKTGSYVPDQDLPYLWFQIAGYALKLSASQYMLTGEDSCMTDYDCLAISPYDSNSDDRFTHILGDTFFRQYYVIFDESNYRIGIGSMENLSVAIDGLNNITTTAESMSSTATSESITSMATSESMSSMITSEATFSSSNIPNDIQTTAEPVSSSSSHGNHIIMVVGITVSIILIAVILVFVYRIHKKRRKNNDIYVQINAEPMAMIVTDHRINKDNPVKENSDDEDDKLCVVCMENEKDHIIIPCGHICVCQQCKEECYDGNIEATCPICRCKFEKIMKTYQ